MPNSGALRGALKIRTTAEATKKATPSIGVEAKKSAVRDAILLSNEGAAAKMFGD